MQVDKVFCVIDPTTANQRALTRAIHFATSLSASLHAYLCLDPASFTQSGEDRNALRNAEIEKQEAWIEWLVQPARELDIPVTTEVEAQDDWREALAPAAQRAGAGLIVKSSYRRTVFQRRFLKTSDWVLLRGAPCPVLLVKVEPEKKVDKVLAAVNLNAEDEPHKILTEKVIDYAQGIARKFGAELHAANAYSGSLRFVHPPDLARKVGIERRFAHVGDMSPESLLREVVETHKIPLVVVGSIARRGVSSVVVGNTAERILDSMPADVLVIRQARTEA